MLTDDRVMFYFDPLYMVLALPGLVLALLSAAPAAQVLPFRSFGTREGLPHENVAALLEDSRGFLWIGTWEGLACFDGAGFESYGAAEGLTSSVPFVIAEDGRGDVWFGVHGAGVARIAERQEIGQPRRAVALSPAGKPRHAQGRHERIVAGGERRFEAGVDRPSAWAAPRRRNRDRGDAVGSVRAMRVDPLLEQPLLVVSTAPTISHPTISAPSARRFDSARSRLM